MTNKNKELQERCLDIFMREIHSTKHQIQKIPMVLNIIIQETKDSMGTQPPKAEPVDVEELVEVLFYKYAKEYKTENGYSVLTVPEHKFLKSVKENIGLFSQSPQQTKE